MWSQKELEMLFFFALLHTISMICSIVPYPVTARLWPFLIFETKIVHPLSVPSRQHEDEVLQQWRSLQPDGAVFRVGTSVHWQHYVVNLSEHLLFL